MEIAFLLYNGVTALDVVGPYEVMTGFSNANIKFVGEKIEQISCFGGIKLLTTHLFEDVSRPDIIVIPGGDEIHAIKNKAILNWIKKVHKTSKYTTSVCTGSLILGAANILNNVRATTHWSQIDMLPKYGSIPVNERVVIDGKIISSAGVSAGIDMALYVAELLEGKELSQLIQLGLEYSPVSLFHASCVDNAPSAIISKAKQNIGFGHDRSMSF